MQAYISVKPSATTQKLTKWGSERCYQKGRRHAVRNPLPPAEQRKKLWIHGLVKEKKKYTKFIFIYRSLVPSGLLNPQQQQQRRQQQEEEDDCRMSCASSEGLLVDVLLVQGAAGGGGACGVQVAVGAHVVEVSRELHLLGLLPERLPDGRRLLRTAGHRRVGAVMEGVPRPADTERTMMMMMMMSRTFNNLYYSDAVKLIRGSNSVTQLLLFIKKMLHKELLKVQSNFSKLWFMSHLEQT